MLLHHIPKTKDVHWWGGSLARLATVCLKNIDPFLQESIQDTASSLQVLTQRSYMPEIMAELRPLIVTNQSNL